MSVKSSLVAVLAVCCCTLTSCTATATNPPATAPITAPTVISTPVPAPTPSPSQTSAPPKLFMAGDLIDATAFHVAVFSTPSGQIKCTVSSNQTACKLHNALKDRRPDPKKYCTDKDPFVYGPQVLEHGKGHYLCGLQDSSFVSLDFDPTGTTGWFPQTGLNPIQCSEGEKCAVLPYGKTLKVGHHACVVDPEKGVTCKNSEGHGFTHRLGPDGKEDTKFF